ncbi:MAG: hypothetical protein DHS20C08_04360 [Rhodomicrobium sp.]|nr:MAG: hypothetical protein DHS20C08_04360 [Rhodomicrobium sp.]
MENEPWSKENIAKRLKWLRSHSGLSQSEFSDSLGISVTNYNNWERGRQRMSLDGALQVNRVYGTTLDFLYLGRLESLSTSMARSFAEFSDVAES